MRFYESHTLSNTDNKHSFFTKKRLLLTEKILKKIPELEKADITIRTQYFNDGHSCKVYLEIDGRIAIYCILSTVEYNCSAVMVAGLSTENYYRSGLGWFLLDLVEQWAIYAGYTLLIGNTADREQNLLIPKFKENGWIESDIQYVNFRTRNKNIWLYKIIADANEEPEEDDDDYEEDNEQDEDF